MSSNVVRELINRISFKINPADKANAQKAFANIKRDAATVIAGTKKIAKATLAAITTLTVAGAKIFTDFEKDVASVKFFSRTNEEAEKLLEIVNEIRGEGIISKRERGQAAAILAELTAPLAAFERALPILKDISIAQPKLDFPQTVKLFAEFVQSGDIEPLRQLGAVGKDLAEQLSLANLDLNQSVKGQQNRAELLTAELDKQKDRIKDLATEQKQSLTFAFRGLAKEASDFSFNFGEETAPQIKEIVSLIRDTIKELNESEDFWGTVKTGADAILGTLNAALNIAKILRQKKKEDDEKVESVVGLTEAARFARDVSNLGLFEALKEARKRVKAAEGAEGGGDIGGFFKNLTLSSDENRELFSKSGRSGAQLIEVNLNGEISVKGIEGPGGEQLKSKVSEEIVTGIKESFRNVAAQSGRAVSTGGR